MGEEAAVIAKDLVKTYRQREGRIRKRIREVKALDGIDLQVKRGELFGLLGPNGAGKTTLIKVLTTLLLPDEGEAWVNGYHVVKEANQVRRSIGVMLVGERGLYWKLTGRENLELFAALYHLSPREARKRIEELTDLLELQEFIDRLVETYSSGQKALVNLARALVNDAPILFLDEPTRGLDPIRARKIRDVIRHLVREQGKTVFLATHNMAEAETLCDRVAIIDLGRIVAVGPPDELKEQVREKGVLEVVLLDDPKPIIEELRQLDCVIKAGYRVETDRSILRVVCRDEVDSFPRVIRFLNERGRRILYAQPSHATLEDVFIYYTGRSLAIDTWRGVPAA